MKPFQTILKMTAAVAVFAASIAFADPYAVGSKVTPFSANDQHGAAFTLDTKATRFMLVSFDMETGKKANASLTGLGADYLPGKKAIYVANIFGMPGIGRMFAIPKMKGYAHRIILGDDANLLTPYPQQPAKVTVLKLDDGKVTKVSYWDPAAEGVDGYLK
ncbi:MAG: hypothetical protein CFE26_10915 [Verrucomicrobiales bacterium VVV1]|nr:MAG: hypothetical protein CFE26_10915 [Verrucomicrobiales bacterium VVV1]